MGLYQCSLVLARRSHYGQARHRVGALDYCGITDARLEMFHDTTRDDATRAVMVERARDLGGAFGQAPG